SLGTRGRVAARVRHVTDPTHAVRRVAVVGGSLALLYVAVVAVTSVLTDHPVRPLFDAGAPPPPYQWVKPPPDFAPGNVLPKRTEFDLSVKPDSIISGSSRDGQFVFSIPKGGIAETPTTSTVHVRIEPLDPDKVG